MTKAMDLYKWEIIYSNRSEMYPVINELAERLEPEHGIRLRRMRKRNLRNEVRAFMEVYNEAWSKNWGFVPLTDGELDHLAKELKPVLDEDFACVAEREDGEVAGVSLSLPDFNRVLARLNGRLLPLEPKRRRSVWAIAVDLVHAASMLAAAVSRDLRRDALRSAAVATAFSALSASRR